MSLQIINSNVVDNLINQLSDINTSSKDNPFIPDYLICRNSAVKTYISQRLSDRQGIVANLVLENDMQAFAEKILSEIAYLGADVPTPPADKGCVADKIFEVLMSEELKSIKELEILNDYLGDEQDEHKALSLSSVIADIFDSMQKYHSDVLKSWLEGKDADCCFETALPDHLKKNLVWQKCLFCKVSDGLLSDFYEKAAKLIQGSRECLKNFAGEVFIFDDKLSTHAELTFLKEISDVFSIRLFNLACADPNNAQDKPPKLNSFGALSKESAELQKSVFDSMNPKAQTENLFDKPAGSDVLSYLKRAVNGTPDGTLTISADDDSFQVRSCHCHMREVEVLKDAILHQLSKDEKSSPNDVLVLVNDIQRYKPYIEAIFEEENKDGGHLKTSLPFSIACSSEAESNPDASAVIEILSLADGHFNVEVMQSLLSVEPLRRAFRLSSDDCSVIRRWMVKSNVHFGFNSDDLETIAPGCSDLNWTLEKGMERLVEEFVMGSSQKDSSCCDISSSDIEALEKFSKLNLKMSGIFRKLKAFGKSAEAGNLIKFIKEDILPVFIRIDKDDKEEKTERNAIYKALDGIEKTFLQNNKNRLLSPALLVEMLKSHLCSIHSPQKVLNGTITFAPMGAVRGVPYNHIYVLGLDAASFPGRDTYESFNLDSVKDLRNSRALSAVDKNRNLILELILCARKSLYMSYIGQSSVDSKKFSPSVVISEILDCLKNAAVNEVAGYGALTVEDRLLRLECLHNYDIRNYSQSAASNANRGPIPFYSSYAKTLCVPKPENRNASLGWNWAADCEANEEKERCKNIKLSLEDLKKFVKKPCKTFLYESLGIYLKVSEDEYGAACEPFNIGKDKFAEPDLISEMLCTDIDPKKFMELLESKQRQGSLPHANIFHAKKNELLEKVNNMRAALRDDSSSDANKEYHIRFKLDDGTDVNIEGTLPKWPNYILRTNKEKLDQYSVNFNAYVDAYFRKSALLAANAQNPDIKLIVCSGEKAPINTSVNDVNSSLKELVELYLRGKMIPVPLSTSVYEKIHETSKKNNNENIEDKTLYSSKIINNELKISEDMFKYDEFASFLYKKTDNQQLSPDQSNLFNDLVNFVETQIWNESEKQTSDGSSEA